MPRLPRLHLKDVIYFVSLEGPSAEPIFRDAADYEKYLELLKRSKSEYCFKLFSYVLLPDRLHLLIEVDELFPLSVIMQKITPQYTKYYNSRYDRNGHLFTKRYRSGIVEKESNLVSLTKFFHALPKFTGVANSSDYPYSSFKYFQNDMNVNGTNLFVEVPEVLAAFSKEINHLSYRQYVEAAGEYEMKETEKMLARPIVGSDAFVADIKNKINKSKEEPEPQIQFNEPAASAPARKNYARLPLLAALLFSVGLSLYAVSLNRPMFSLNPVIKGNPSSQSAQRIELNVKEPGTADLNGTIWEVELLSVAPDGSTHPIRDKITFTGKSFQSHYFSSQGFSPSNYTVTVQDNGFITWETIQTNSKGETISWHGDWEGKKMDGVLSHRSSNQNPEDFSFFSKGLNPNG